VYAIDLLGQGQSWPTQVQCQQSGPLCYSADTWTEQLFHFIEEKIGQPVYIAGNSLGGAQLPWGSTSSDIGVAVYDLVALWLTWLAPLWLKL
jgi:pimeloyl-ACP methyl ester carboxylesterase